MFSDTLKTVIETSQSHVAVTAVTQADQAESVLRRGAVDAVFLDIALPDGNGIVFIGTIKRLAPDACIVVLSSYDSMEYKHASLGEGADYFLSKERSGGLRLLHVIDRSVQGNGDA